MSAIQAGRPRELPLFPDAFPPDIKPDTSALLPSLNDYDRVIVFLSGGKDSIHVLIKLLEKGVHPERLELWHNAVDGRPRFLGGAPGLFSWPFEENYVRACARSFNLPLLFQWREGGIEREMNRVDERTQPSSYQLGDGQIKTSGGERDIRRTRLMFPQTGSISNGRWCSSKVKKEPSGAAICGDPRFESATILIASGERREESATRARYAEVEAHHTTTRRRRVDHWRVAINDTEHEVWESLRRYGIIPAPCYYLGFSRFSCFTCVFLQQEWLAVRTLDPARFAKISDYERLFGKTIKQGVSVIEQAASAAPMLKEGDYEMIKLAMDYDYPLDRFLLKPGEVWHLPRGAYRRGNGPS